MTIIDPICLIDDDTPTISHGKDSAGIASGKQTEEFIMSIRNTVLAATFVLASAGAAQADGLGQTAPQKVDLGTMSGVAYYTVEPDGFRVVTTLGEGETGTPVRFVAVLAPGQSVVLSTPRAAGVAPVAVEISRHADTVLVRKAAATN